MLEMDSRDEPRHADVRTNEAHMEGAANRKEAGVQGSVGHLRLDAIDSPAAHICPARRDELVVVQRLHDRHAASRRNDHRGCRQLWVELVQMDDVGSEALDETAHRRGRGGIPERFRRDHALRTGSQPVAALTRHRRPDELAVVLAFEGASVARKCHLVTTLPQDRGKLETVPVRAPRDVRELVASTISSPEPAGPLTIAPGFPPRGSGLTRGRRRKSPA